MLADPPPVSGPCMRRRAPRDQKDRRSSVRRDSSVRVRDPTSRIARRGCSGIHPTRRYNSQWKSSLQLRLVAIWAFTLCERAADGLLTRVPSEPPPPLLRRVARSGPGRHALPVSSSHCRESRQRRSEVAGSRAQTGSGLCFVRRSPLVSARCERRSHHLPAVASMRERVSACISIAVCDRLGQS